MDRQSILRSDIVNPNTGKVYTSIEDIRRAVERGEKLIPVSQRTAEIVEQGRSARRQGLISARQQRKQRKAQRRLDAHKERTHASSNKD